MGVYNTLVAWFFTFNILLFFLIECWIIPGVNFVAGIYIICICRYKFNIFHGSCFNQ